jgi:putative phosphoesterase
MKIGVFSDTHLKSAKGLPRKALDLISSVDAIIHAGDYQDISIVETLTDLKDFYGVFGNMDSGHIRAVLPEKRVVELNGFKIGITHGWGAPKGIESRVRAFFSEEDLSAIVFGHSHTPCNKVIDHILFFNPGSPTDKRQTEHRTMGILTLDKSISGEIIHLD